MSLSKILHVSFDDLSSITSLGITLMLMLMGFIYFYFYSNSSPSATKKQKSSSIQKRFKYDVFISFMGEDTCKDFGDRLYQALNDKGIYTYKDDGKIQNEDGMSYDLIEAIEDSKFYIIVLSENYASSKWCLDVLVKIMECRRKDKEHTAIPVFYDVESTEVSRQSGSVEKAFSKNKNKEAAEKWRRALTEAADLTGGWKLKSTFDGDQDKFIKKIVQQMIMQEIKISFSSSYRHSVTPATYFLDFIVMLSLVLNKLVEAIGSLTAFLGQLWATYYRRVVEVDLTPGPAFSFIIWCLLVFAGLKSQSVTGFPFKTHPNAIKVPVNSLLIYAFASMAELVVSVAGLDRTSVYAFIARLGRIISLCLFVMSLAILIYI